MSLILAVALNTLKKYDEAVKWYILLYFSFSEAII